MWLQAEREAAYAQRNPGDATVFGSEGGFSHVNRNSTLPKVWPRRLA